VLVAPTIYGSIAFSNWRDHTILVRGRAEPRALEAAVRAAVREIDPGQPVTHVRMLEEVRRDALGGARLLATLLGIFAALALALTATGIGGVIAFSVSQRTREFGIRLALGAAPASVVRMVLGQGLRLVAIGLLLGGAAAVALSRLLAGMLYGVTAADPLTFVSVALVLVLAGVAACLMPALRATAVDPMTSLRAT
jgi:putative ABC transport system permease protein